MSIPRDILYGSIFALKCSLNLLSIETKYTAIIRKCIFPYWRLFCKTQVPTPADLYGIIFFSHFFLGKNKAQAAKVLSE